MRGKTQELQFKLSDSAMAAVVPSDKSVAELNDVDKALVRALFLLQKDMPTDPDAHEERFRYFSESAMRAPFLVLEMSEGDSQTWKDKEMTVKDVLAVVLPKVIMAAISPKLPAIQDIIDSAAEIGGLGSFFCSRQEGNKRVMQFFINHIEEWGKKRLGVYFVEIKASFNTEAWFGIVSSTSNFLEARFCTQKYITNTDFLLNEMQSDPAQVDKQMEEWAKTMHKNN